MYGDDFLALRVFLRHRHRTGESYKRGIYNRLGLIVGFLLCARVFCFWLVCFFVFFHFSLVLFSKGRQVRNSLHSFTFWDWTSNKRSNRLAVNCPVLGAVLWRWCWSTWLFKKTKTKKTPATKQTTAGFCPLPPPPQGLNMRLYLAVAVLMLVLATCTGESDGFSRAPQSALVMRAGQMK